MNTYRLRSEDSEDRAESARPALGIEAYYAGPMPLTLGKLRTALETLSTLHADRQPSIGELARAIRGLGLEHLSVSSVEALVGVCSETKPDDIAGSFTLKQLEDLLGRIERG